MESAPSLPNQRIRTTRDGCLFVLDDAGVFFAVARQELYVFNTSATLIWCCIEEGLATDEIVAHYCEAFGASVQEAQEHVATALDQWWGLGYIDAPEIRGMAPASFATVLARLLSNERLRRAFAAAPVETARRLWVDSADLDAVLALDPALLERETVRLRNRPGRLAIEPGGRDTLFAAEAAGDRSVLEVAVDGRLRGIATAPIERHYRLLDTNFRMRFASAAQEACVDAALGHLAIDPPPDSHVLLDIVEGDGGHVIIDGVVPVGHCRQLEQLTPSVKSVIGIAAINRHRFFLELHAGVVSNGERCILLPAASGSGKTTLTAGLTRAGFAYFSDEVALLEEVTLELRPFPLALGVKRGALAAIAELWPEVCELQAHQRVDGEQVRYLALPAESCAPSEVMCAARWLIFPRYGVDLETELRPISRPEALRRLMHECMVLPQFLDELRVEKLVQWMRTLECYELPMSSLGRAVELITERCRSTPGPPTGHQSYVAAALEVVDPVCDVDPLLARMS